MARIIVDLDPEELRNPRVRLATRSGDATDINISVGPVRLVGDLSAARWFADLLQKELDEIVREVDRMDDERQAAVNRQGVARARRTLNESVAHAISERRY